MTDTTTIYLTRMPGLFEIGSRRIYRKSQLSTLRRLRFEYNRASRRTLAAWSRSMGFKHRSRFENLKLENAR